MDYLSIVNFNDSRPVKMRIDYGTRTDGQPLYQGFANTRLDEGDNGWIIFEFTYSADPGNLTEKNVSYGAWSDRAALTYS